MKKHIHINESLCEHGCRICQKAETCWSRSSKLNKRKQKTNESLPVLPGVILGSLGSRPHATGLGCPETSLSPASSSALRAGVSSRWSWGFGFVFRLPPAALGFSWERAGLDWDLAAWDFFTFLGNFWTVTRSFWISWGVTAESVKTEAFFWVCLLNFSSCEDWSASCCSCVLPSSCCVSHHSPGGFLLLLLVADTSETSGSGSISTTSLVFSVFFPFRCFFGASGLDAGSLFAVLTGT